MKRWWPPTRLMIAPLALAILGCDTMFVTSDRDSAASGDYVVTGQTTSFFTALQVDPRSEDSAGPQFVAAADLDGDGLMDLASIWNESQPVQVHLQRRGANGQIFFETVAIGGTTPIARVSGLEIADLDQDGHQDLIVLVKDTGLLATCDPQRPDCDVTNNGGIISGAVDGGLVLFFGPEDSTADIWEPVVLVNSFFAGTDGDRPEDGGYTGIDIGDFDGRNGPDIVVAFNSAEGDPPGNRIDIYPNPGGAASRADDGWDNVTVYENLPTAKSVAVLDVDRDGDDDIVATYPDSASSNVFWLPNPLSRDGADAVSSSLAWNLFGPIGQVATNADALAIGDVDGDGIDDVLVRSSEGRIVQWFQGPAEPSKTFVRSPWRVFTLAEFLDREPQAMAIGDLTGDDQVEAVIAAQGAVVWFDSSRAASVYDHWGENVIVDEGAPADDATIDPAAVTDPTGDPTEQSLEDTGTFINTLLIADIDGDGFNDIVGTIDRDELSGLANDALVWFRNRR